MGSLFGLIMDHLKDLIHSVNINIIAWLNLDLKLVGDELNFFDSKFDSKHNSPLHSFLELRNYNFSLGHIIQEVSDCKKHCNYRGFTRSFPHRVSNVPLLYRPIFIIRYGRLNCGLNTLIHTHTNTCTHTFVRMW